MIDSRNKDKIIKRLKGHVRVNDEHQILQYKSKS